MVPYEVKGFISDLVDDGIIPAQFSKEVYDAAEEYFKDVVLIGWGVDDITSRAADRDIALSDDAARNVLETMYHRHDANIGINWDVVDENTDAVLSE